jgi:hypothetical protein
MATTWIDDETFCIRRTSGLGRRVRRLIQFCAHLLFFAALPFHTHLTLRDRCDLILPPDDHLVKVDFDRNPDATAPAMRHLSGRATSWQVQDRASGVLPVDLVFELIDFRAARSVCYRIL